MAEQHPDHACVGDDTDDSAVIRRRHQFNLRNNPIPEIPEAFTRRGFEAGQIFAACMPELWVTFSYAAPGFALPFTEMNFPQLPADPNVRVAVFKNDPDRFGGPF